MEINKNLSIVIPTYNRADFLDYSLEVHIPMLKEYGIEIAIFDNASTDNTEEIVSKWMKEYDYLTYHKNETNIGPDANFEKALKYPDTDYVWLLGDTYKLPVGIFEYLTDIINRKSNIYDVFVFNLNNTLKITSQDYNDANLLLNELGALMTCSAVSIYKKELIMNANFSRYYDSYFIQTGIIFEEIITRNFLIHWQDNFSIGVLNGKKSLKKDSWYSTSQLFYLGSEKWANFIFSLPPYYNLSIKMKVVRDFAKITPHFNFKNLIKLRMNNQLNYNIFNKYKTSLWITINFKILIVLFVSLIPQSLLKLIKRIGG